MIRIDGEERIRQRLRQLVPELQAEATRAGAQAAFDSAQRGADAHTKTGAMARSLKMRPIRSGYEVYHDLQMAPHAVFVHWGTRPHVIKPKNKQALRWPAGGAFAFAKVVNHPGYRGDAWMLRARRDAERAIIAIANRTEL